MRWLVVFVSLLPALLVAIRCRKNETTMQAYNFLKENCGTSKKGPGRCSNEDIGVTWDNQHQTVLVRYKQNNKNFSITKVLERWLTFNIDQKFYGHYNITRCVWMMMKNGQPYITKEERPKPKLPTQSSKGVALVVAVFSIILSFSLALIAKDCLRWHREMEKLREKERKEMEEELKADRLTRQRIAALLKEGIKQSKDDENDAEEEEEEDEYEKNEDEWEPENEEDIRLMKQLRELKDCKEFKKLKEEFAKENDDLDSDFDDLDDDWRELDEKKAARERELKNGSPTQKEKDDDKIQIISL